MRNISKIWFICTLVMALLACEKEDAILENRFLGNWQIKNIDLELDGTTYKISETETIKYMGLETVHFYEDSTFLRTSDGQESAFARWKYYPFSKNIELKYASKKRTDLYTMSEVDEQMLQLSTIKMSTREPIKTDYESEIVNKVYFLILGYKGTDKPTNWTSIIVKHNYKKINE